MVTRAWQNWIKSSAGVFVGLALLSGCGETKKPAATPDKPAETAPAAETPADDTMDEEKTADNAAADKPAAKDPAGKVDEGPVDATGTPEFPNEELPK